MPGETPAQRARRGANRRPKVRASSTDVYWYKDRATGTMKSRKRKRPVQRKFKRGGQSKAVRQHAANRKRISGK